MSINSIILSIALFATIANGANLRREKLEQVVFNKNTALTMDLDKRPPRLLLLTTSKELVADLLKRSSASDISQFDLDQPHLVSVAANDNSGKTSNYIKLPEQVTTVLGLVGMLTDIGIPGWNPAEVGQSLLNGEFDIFKLPFRALADNTFETQNSSNNIDELAMESTDSTELEPIDE